jgi:hypothetical protein
MGRRRIVAVADDRRRRRRRADEEGGSDAPGQGSDTSGLPIAELAQRARDQLTEITGLTAEGVTSLKQHDDGTWRVSVELLELSRIPDALDVIGSYQVEIDDDGELLGYERVRRYSRSQKDLTQPVGES